MPAFSVLDLAPVGEGSSVRQALLNARDLAQHAEAWGYQRFWLAEHHNMPGIASAATAVVMAHVAAATKSIRVGSGGIMLPNHAPLVIAEQFGTLAELYPHRIDLGVGRAPGTDMPTSKALRRRLSTSVDEFPQDINELMSYFEEQQGAAVRAIPGAGCDVEVWLLGSSLYGAQLAAALGSRTRTMRHVHCSLRFSRPCSLCAAVNVAACLSPLQISTKPWISRAESWWKNF